MKKNIIISTFIILILLATSAHAWLIYSKPEFRGLIPMWGISVLIWDILLWKTFTTYSRHGVSRRHQQIFN
jgi:hypothetical protein